MVYAFRGIALQLRPLMELQLWLHATYHEPRIAS